MSVTPMTTTACGDDEAAGPEVASAPYGLDARPPNPTCRAPQRLIDPDGVAFESAFDALTFTEPVQMLIDPRDNQRVYVLERAGVVKVFPNVKDVKEATVFIDIKTEVSSQYQESGLLGMAFDPDYEVNHYVYLSYTGFGGGPVDLGSLIVRYETKDDGLTLDPSTKEIVFGPLVQPFENHNGGHIVFGPDGNLYFGLGDGGDGGDPKGNGQNRDVLFGKLLRINVKTLPYTIPSDNPFASGGGQKEIYAYGFRNPWRFQFDKANGDLWLGDVGEDTEEEIDKVVLGGNYGWNVKEGKGCLEGRPCDGTGLIDPIVSYGHDEGLSVVGGFVYHGTAIPHLANAYIYGDTISGSIWALFPNSPTPRLLNPGGPSPTVVSFAQDGDGELYVVSIGNGKIFKLVVPDPASSTKFPKTLTATGCFDPADATKLSAALIPYDVNSPLWSDGARKERFFAIPDGKKIDVDPDGDLELPEGSVAVKTFFLGDKRVETRLFVHHEDGGWGGYTYEWNDAQTDATLLATNKTKRVGDRDWYFPSRGECFRCHTEGAGRTLGLEIGQLNGDFVYTSTSRRSNQVETLAHLEMFSTPQSRAGKVIPKPTDEAISVNDRARAYLHSNCSICHRPGGISQGGMDFRYDTPFREMKICNVDPSHGTLDVAGAKILAAGDPAKSIMSLRTHAAEKNRMPPVASRIVDDEGTKLLDEWIRETTTCPP